MAENISFDELKGFVAKHLATALGISNFDITYAELLEEKGLWDVNVEYETESQFRTIIALSVDAKTGEVKGLWKDRSWI